MPNALAELGVKIAVDEISGQRLVLIPGAVFDVPAPTSGTLVERMVQPGAAPTHKIIALRTFAFPGPSIKLPPVETLVMGTTITVQREENSYVRLKCEKALKDMNASIGTF